MPFGRTAHMHDSVRVRVRVRIRIRSRTHIRIRHGKQVITQQALTPPQPRIVCISSAL